MSGERSHRLNEADWRGISPAIADEFARDVRILRAVDKLLSPTVTADVMDSLLGVTRVLVEQRDGVICDNKRLAYEVDRASSFLCNPNEHGKHFLTSHYVLLDPNS
jgi:hypothetical protein